MYVLEEGWFYIYNVISHVYFKLLVDLVALGKAERGYVSKNKYFKRSL